MISITMASSSSITSFLSFSLTLLLLSHVSLAKLGFVSPNECRIESLDAQDPALRVRSEAGYTDFYDSTRDQFNCAGVSVTRRTIQPGGLLLPSYANAPSLVYILQGRGTMGVSLPGCPESFQEFQESRGEHWSENDGERRQWQVRDQHQQVNRIREGDVIALHVGVTNWAYNDGDSPLIAITLTDTSNEDNQLDRHHREFMLAGRQQHQQHERGQAQNYREDEDLREGVSEVVKPRNNILNGFDTDFLADALGINRQLASRLQSQNDNRGEIVQVREMFDVVSPFSSSSYPRRGSESPRRGNESMNGIEQAYCTMKIKENIGDPSRADVFNPRAGRITTLNRFKLPILRNIMLSATRGYLRRNAFLAPQWSANAHNIMYVIRGRCRCQVVDNRGRTVFNGEVRQGQVLVIPQNFAQLKQAKSDDFEWISFITNENEISSPIVGKASVLKGLPEEVLMNLYRISRQEARNLKWNRGQEYGVFPSTSSRSYREREVA